MIRAFGYYIRHTFVNTLKKIFRTWVIWFFVVIIAVSLIVVLAAGLSEGGSDGNTAQAGDSITTETGDVSGNNGDVTDTSSEGVPDDEINLRFQESSVQILELICGAVVLIIIAFAILSSDKSGSSIFLMADVNTLFSALVKPQSVLMFRILMQMGTTVLGSIYFLYQIPNLISIGFDIISVLSIYLSFLLVLIFMKLLTELLYIAGSVHGKIKNIVRYTLFGVLLALVAGYLIYYKMSGLSPLDAAFSMFCSAPSRIIPVWGWLKSLPVLIAQGSYLTAALSFLGIIATDVLIIFVAWHIKADYYEDVMDSAAKRQAALESAAEGRSARTVKHGDSDKLKEISFGKSGARNFLVKSVRCKLRLSKFIIFSGISVTYLVISASIACITRFAFSAQILLPAAAGIGAVVYFRSFSNPLADETGGVYFYLAPLSTYSKVIYCMLANTVNCIIELVVPVAVASLILLPDPLEILLCFVFLITVNLMVASAGFFANMIVPTTLHKSIAAIIQLLIMMIAAIPSIISVIYVTAFGFYPLALLVGSAVNLFAGVVMLLFSPLLVRCRNN